MKFTEKLWKNIAPIYQAILEHPFNRELMQGKLSPERFTFYVQQDALYLAGFARGLSLLAAKSQNAPEDFISFAAGVFEVEKSMHAEFFEVFQIGKPAQKQSPACFAYTQYVLAQTTLKSYEEGLAAVLPCFWIYREAGNHIHAGASPANPYQKWIDTYASPEFSQVVDRALALTDEAALGAGEGLRAAMEEAFETASRLEWLFWDSAYRLEAWQPAV
jgi:thiaminase/transcriptional activator TenA